MFCIFYAVKEEKKSKILLSSLKTLIGPNFKYCSKSRIKISVPTFLSKVVSFQEAFGTIFRITGSFFSGKFLEPKAALCESQQDLYKGFWKDFRQ
jgi:hypothetical protein